MEMGKVELIGEIPKPRNGSKWKIVIGGKEIRPSIEAVPPTIKYSNASINPFLVEAEKFSKKYKDAFEGEDATARNN